jgi:hypothetical protein
MATDPSPSALRLPTALAAVALSAALATVFAMAGCGGAAEPISRPEGAAPAAAEPAAAGAPEGAPVNASPEARIRPPRTPKPPPEVEPRSEWSIDESIPTPEELEKLEILAKFKKGPDVVIIYRARNGDVYRRVQGALGAYTRVEESKIELEE